MQILLTRLNPTHHEFKVIRDDGTEESAQLEGRSFVTHDFIHFAYEKAAGLKDSFYGKLAAGAGFEDFGTSTRSMAEDVSTEAAQTEMITGPLHGFLTQNSKPELTIAGVKMMFEARGLPVPQHFTEVFLKDVAARYRALMGEWNKLPFGKTMVLEFP